MFARIVGLAFAAVLAAGAVLVVVGKYDVVLLISIKQPPATLPTPALTPDRPDMPLQLHLKSKCPFCPRGDNGDIPTTGGVLV